MTETTTTYSLEVLAFPGAPDESALPDSFAEVFGISKEEAERIVAAVPVAVKQGADAETTRRLAKVLLQLGAELCIRNEQTGEERIQQARGGLAAEEASDTNPAEPAPAKHDEVAKFDAATESKVEAEADAKADAKADEAPVSPPPASPAPEGASKSIPPPGKSVPPPSKMAPLDNCASCNRHMEKGGRCQTCGWSNKDSRRYCRQCGLKLTIASDPIQKRVLLLAISIVCILAAGVAGYFFGIFPAAVLLALLVAGVFVADSRTMSFRCPPCSRKVESYTLRSSEKKSLAIARRRGALVGVLCVLVGAGFAIPMFTTTRTLHVDSFGMGWNARVPMSHRDVERRMATVATPSGEKRMVIQRAMNTRFPVESFQLMLVTLSSKPLLTLEDPQMERVMAKALEAALGGGAEVSKPSTVSTSIGPARESRFQTVLQGRKLGGRIRTLLFDENAVMMVFVASGDDAADKPGGNAFFASLEMERTIPPR